MEYQLEIDDKIMAVELSPGETGPTARAVINDTPYDLTFGRGPGCQVFMTIDNRQVKAWVERTASGKNIILDGEHYFIQDKNAQDQNRSGGRKSGSGQEPTAVTPPMPAIVIQVAVALGDAVQKGDSVVVVSAMKMETTLNAPYAGKVTRISVAEGDKVMPGDILVDIEKGKNTP